MNKASSRSVPVIKLRRGRMSDLDALVQIERAVFTTDVLSRRSFRRFLAAASAALIVAEADGTVAGYVLVLYPPRSEFARLYSIAVAPQLGRRGVGPRLLAAGEAAARRRGRKAMRLEVHERNRRAIARYVKSGYRLFGRHYHYYDDRGDALRFEKALGPTPGGAHGSPTAQPDSHTRIGFHGGHRGRRSRQSFRFRL